MTPEQILKELVRVLSQPQREHYIEYGFVGVEEFVPFDMLDPLQQTIEAFVDKRRAVTGSADEVFDIGPGHSAESPFYAGLRPQIIAAKYTAHSLLV